MPIYQWCYCLLTWSAMNLCMSHCKSYFRSNIFRGESGSTTGDDQIDRAGTVGPLRDGLLDCQYVIRHNVGFCDIPLVIAGAAEDVF